MAMICAAAPVYAAVYASDLSIDKTAINVIADYPVTISYRLNDTGASVEVIIRDVGTSTAIRTLDATEADPNHQPGTARGVNAVQWDGRDDGGVYAPIDNYSYEVRCYNSSDPVAGFQTTRWYQLLDAGAPANPYANAINTNPSSSHFGHIYVVHNREDAGTGDTIYEYPSDMGVPLSTGDNQIGVAVTSGAPDDSSPINWDDGGLVPRYLVIDADDYVYACNWHEGATPPNNMHEVWRLDADLTNAVVVLGEGTNAELADAQKACYVTGTGTDKRIYVMDTGALAGDPQVLVWRDTDGDGTWADESLETSFILSDVNDGDSTAMSIAVDAAGNIFVTSDEGAAGGEASIAMYNSSGVNQWRNNTFTYVRQLGLWYGANAGSTADDVLVVDSIVGSSSGCTEIDISTGLATTNAGQTWSAYQSFDVVGNICNTSQAGAYVKMSRIENSIIDYTTTGLTTMNVAVPVELSIFESN
jgi:hypothetical protein